MDIGGIGEFSLIASIRRRMEGRYPPEVARGSATTAPCYSLNRAWNG